jgi:hypothetical protein
VGVFFFDAVLPQNMQTTNRNFDFQQKERKQL